MEAELARGVEMTVITLEDVFMVDNSPLLVENKHHPLLGHDDEMDAHRLETMSLPLVVRPFPISMKEVPTLGITLVLQ